MGWHKLFFLILLIPVLLSATITFERTYGGVTGYEVACTSDYGYAIVGFYALYRDIIYLVKTDSLGDTLWTSLVSQPYVNKGSYSLKELSDGGFIAVGYRDSINDPIPADAYLVRFNSFGDTLWSKLYGGDSLDKGYWIEITPDSNFIIVGETKSYGVGNSDVLFMKTDTGGNVLWSRTYGGDSYDLGRCVKNMSDNGFIIVGSTYSFGAGFRDIYLIKTDSVGNPEWIKTYGGTNYEWGHDVEVTPDSGYIVVGQTNSFGALGQDVYFIKTDSLGDTLWTKTYGGADDDVGYSVAITSDGGYIIAGYTTHYVGGDKDVWLIKTDSLGDILWTRTYGSVDDDCAYSIKNTLDNGFIIAGSTSSGVYLIKTDSLGNAGIEEKEISDFAYQLPVLRIFPSLVTGSLNIKYAVYTQTEIELSLYDVTGSRIKVLKQEKVLPGYYQEKINVSNFSNGVYFIVLRQGNDKVSRKFLLIK